MSPSLPHFHQAPTLIGCYFLKNHPASAFLPLRYAAKRRVRQQQRNEIMKHFLSCVKLFSFAHPRNHFF
jgi:hypothetical protein